MKTTTKIFLTSCLVTLNIISLPFGESWSGASSFAGNGKEAIAQEAAKNFGSNTQYGFIENKGQIVDQNGKPNSDVLFMNVSSGLKVQLTKKGFSYECYKIDRKESEVQSAMKQHNKLLQKPALTISSIETHRVDVELENINQQVEVIAEDPASDYLNYYTQGTPEEGITGVKHYRKVTYKNIYPNIDVEFVISDLTPALSSTPEPVEGGEEAKKGGVEYNFIVRPGGRVEDIRLQYKGANDLKLTDDGRLQIATSLGNVEEHIPYSFQPNGTKETSIGVSYQKEGNTFSFKANAYDKTKTLVIDPTPSLTWGTYYGGSGDEYSGSCQGIATDSNKDILIVSRTNSASAIATAGAFQTTMSGGGVGSIMIVKLKSDGTAPIWATYYGGDDATAIATDGSDNVLILACIQNEFGTPAVTTAGAYQTSCASCGFGDGDVFAAKFNSSGARLWGTYYGDAGSNGYLLLGVHDAIAADNSGNVIIASYTNAGSGGLSSAGAYQTAFGGGYSDGFIVKLNATGTTRLWGTYFGGSGDDFILDVAIDASDNVLVSGITSSTTGIATAGAFQTTHAGGTYDAFVAKFNSAGNSLLWGTYFGGSGDEYPVCIAKDGLGNVLLSGGTTSTSGIASVGAYQTTFGGGSNDAFVAKFNSTGSALNWSTYYGGSGDDAYISPVSVATDASNNVFLSSITNSSNSIATAGAYQPAYGGAGAFSFGDVFVAKFNDVGARQWGTYYGGANDENGHGMATDNAGNVIITGWTISTANIATAGSYQTVFGGVYDAFVAKFGSSGLPIELVSFSAVPVNNQTVLTQWTTASELNSDYFIVERSKEGKDNSDWEYVGTVDAAGNSSSELSYSFTDENPYRGVSSYRLKQADFNGDFQYYGPVAVNLEGISIIALYPNPAVDHIDYSVVSSLESNVAITLVDVLGRKVFSETSKIKTGENKLRLDVSNYPVGMYMIQLVTESGKYKTQKQFVVN